MNQSKSIEVSAADVQTAIDKGIAELGVTQDKVMVEVLEEPSRGLLGLGAKPAKVRLTVIRAPTTTASVPPATSTPPRLPEKAPVDTAKSARRETDEDADDEYAPVLGKKVPVSAEELAEDAKVGVKTLQQLLSNMQIDGAVSASPAETSDDEPPHWILDVQGQNLSLLIGHRGETLASLQYVTRLIASKELGHRANIVIDVEGFKSRRETMLRRLAKRMADQALQRGRTVTLEPMPPHERRIIHLTLRDNPNVTTESVGDGDHRKVTIIPRRDK